MTGEQYCLLAAAVKPTHRLKAHLRGRILTATFILFLATLLSLESSMLRVLSVRCTSLLLTPPSSVLRLFALLDGLLDAGLPPAAMPGLNIAFWCFLVSRELPHVARAVSCVRFLRTQLALKHT